MIQYSYELWSEDLLHAIMIANPYCILINVSTGSDPDLSGWRKYKLSLYYLNTKVQWIQSRGGHLQVKKICAIYICSLSDLFHPYQQSLSRKKICMIYNPQKWNPSNRTCRYLQIWADICSNSQMTVHFAKSAQSVTANF